MPTILAHVHAYVPDHNAGAETTLHDIMKYMISLGWNAEVIIRPEAVSLLTGKAKETKDYWIDGVHVIQGEDKRTLLHYLPRADVTISHLECSERTHLLSKAYKVPTVHLVHNTHPLTVRWMSSSDGLIINTDWIANEEPWSSWDAPKMVLNPPIDPSEYRTEKGKAVTLINLWEDKGSRVFYELAERFPGIPFIGVKGGYGEQVVKELPNVTIMEHTKDMKTVYSQTKVLLMPSKYESFGRVAVEAMASGIPTIAHRTPGLQESLGSAGTFADRDSTDEWETALRELLKPARYGKMSKAATARSKELRAKTEKELHTLGFFFKELIRVGT